VEIETFVCPAESTAGSPLMPQPAAASASSRLPESDVQMILPES